MSEQALETEIKARGADVAPRITPEMIDACIVSEHYVQGENIYNASRATFDRDVMASVHALGCLTICVLVLRNGFTVVGKSACASPENFNAEIGNKIAREDARRQIWALEGYRLRSQLQQNPVAAESA